MGYKEILDFYEFTNEKLGVITQMDMNNYVDVSDVSRISRKFIHDISKHPDKDYTISEQFVNRFIDISYRPNENKQGGYTNKFGDIIIFERINKKNELFVKYILVHEMVHSLQILTKKNKNNKSHLDELKRELCTPSIYEIERAGESKNFLYLIYRTDPLEMNAWVNDAYIHAYKHKLDDQTLTDKEVFRLTLDDVYMSKSFFNKSIKHIKTDTDIFNAILSILVGSFSEISKNKGQQFFDRDVFKLDVVKRLRTDVAKIIFDMYDIGRARDEIFQILMVYMDELIDVKDEIINSFLHHLEYYYMQCRKKMDRAILLGIEDATLNI